MGTAPRIAYRPGEVAAMLGISEMAMRQRLLRGRFPSMTVGGSRLIPAAVVDAVRHGRDPWTAMEKTPAV